MEEQAVNIGSFEWDVAKAKANTEKHGVDFFEAIEAFLDEQRIIAVDEAHSKEEPRYFCIGRVKNRIMTVRFTYRRKKIRIYGAGYWRKGNKLYEKENA
jgi:uncharacterized DUF497 family protein